MSIGRIDTAAVLAGVDIVQVVGAYVQLKKDGKEYRGRCPFHDERTPSFYVSPAKGFAHCFGCGAHYDAIGFLMAYESLTFPQACGRLGHREFAPAQGVAPPEPTAAKPAAGMWRPVLPVPAGIPDLFRDDSGWTVPLWNPKRDKWSRFKPTRADAYRHHDGRLLGYVLRCEFDDGKITPTVTWCVGPDGAQTWCINHFPKPRPLCGLDELATRPDAPVLLSEGEKCRAACAGALPMYVSVTWPGGGKGVSYVDWSPLAGRDVVLWPDADEPGQQAMFGWRDVPGHFHMGVAQYLHRIGVRSMRAIDTDGQPKGWDIADAIDDGWTPKQLASWAATRVQQIEVAA
ncbi:CHC2 zinc finger domain-containing protein [Pseudoxanthomonas winnipegensis]|uniref:CHC2 zinc finger domain-containing protein n=1 Tax=Pseudoxanthomonas winnipegensis TaxID=2480810 RepID=UPI001F17919E|nr:CHC2 zinc finger domain-containing protein [Pseudoxanthomonas winnipegensis]